MSDSDDDYNDVGLENNALVIVDRNDSTGNASRKTNTNSQGKKVRGRDINWIEVGRFNTIIEYKESSVFKDIKEKFSCMRKRSPDYADTEHFVCKYARKVGYVPCPVQYMVIFFSHNDEVSVACADHNEDHVHEVDDNSDVNGGTNFKWTLEQTELIKKCLQYESNRPLAIRRNLENANLFREGNIPTAQQLSNKVAHVRLLLNKSKQIFTTHHLREQISEKLEIPDDEHDPYIASHEVIDEDETAEPRFFVTWTTKRMLARTSSEMTQDDATYRLTWQGKVLVKVLCEFLTLVAFSA